MKLTITEYWNKVIREEGHPFGSRVLRDEYEQKSHLSYPNGGGWKDKKEWQQSVIHRHGFQGFDDKGRARFDQGRAYGIHSYMLVGLED